jgi:hypothetical protein
MMRDSSSVRIDLIVRQRSFARRLRRLAARLLTRRRLSRLARRHFCFVFRRLARVALLGARLDRRARLGDLAQTLLAQRQFVGDRHAVGNIRLVRRLGLGHQIGDLGPQLRLDLARVLIRKRAVSAGVGVDFRAVQPDRSHLQNAHLARKQQHLDEQLLDLFEKPPPERGDRVVVGMIVGRDEPKRHRVIGRPFQLAARKHPRRIAVNKKTQQHSRMVGRRTGAAIIAAHRPKIEPIDHFDNEARQMLLRQPLVHRGRQQIVRLPIDRPEVAHVRRLGIRRQSTPRF